jgi:hypothetical protein
MSRNGASKHSIPRRSRARSTSHSYGGVSAMNERFLTAYALRFPPRRGAIRAMITDGSEAL